MNYLEAVEFVSRSHDEWDDGWEDSWNYEEWDYPEYEDSSEELPNELWEELIPPTTAKTSKHKVKPKTWAWAALTILYVIWWMFVVWYM